MGREGSGGMREVIVGRGGRGLGEDGVSEGKTSIIADACDDLVVASSHAISLLPRAIGRKGRKDRTYRDHTTYHG